ncbi:ThiF family [Popillia japonica]|uniref:Adenylyltransferase and sulfurtransferase MOCS3 homolog n=1 Tax=Popillia japonica TaxID=7064 RepID=A0AAW1K225_POPJA
MYDIRINNDLRMHSNMCIRHKFFLGRMAAEEQKIEKLQDEINQLREELQRKERELFDLKFKKYHDNKYCLGLTATDIMRYSRQMLLSQFSITGQIALKKSRVLIVGMGGLGCPCALYLAAAGIGELTIVDYDEVELTNLHRQVLHGENDIGIPKILSAYNRLKNLNSNIKIIPIHTHANSSTLTDLFKNKTFDVVVDGSDNVATRYLLNDICVLNNLPLVSGSALQMEGQLTVYNYNKGPCYRCLFPVPPPPDTVMNCGDGGVLGPVPGIIGTLQALEVIKILTKQGGVLSSRLLTFDACEAVFRNVKLRTRNSRCAVCGDDPTITTLIDYEEFCGASAHDKVIDVDILRKDDHIPVKELSSKPETLLIDVRPTLEFAMCNLDNSYNFPYSYIKKGKDLDKLRKKLEDYSTNGNEVLIICRRGNDSQRAVLQLKEIFTDLPLKFLNVLGGLYAYSNAVDSSFPIY